MGNKCNHGNDDDSPSRNDGKNSNNNEVEEKGRKDENEERGNWTGKMDFILSLLGFAVGLGNVWRFPYLCYRNGGGAFLIPYAIALIIIGMPLFYVELFLGQFTSSGPLNCWEFAPLFQGIGMAQLVVTGLVGIYYNMIIAWTIFYFFSTLINTRELPWINCRHEWNTPQCYDRLPDVECNGTLTKEVNGTCTNGNTTVGLWSFKVYQNATGLRRTTASEEYYNNRVLGLSSGIHDLGAMKWELVLCLALAWIICFACMVKGIKTTGKVVYFTALFPYVVLVILLGRGVSLPGATDGLIFFLRPDFSRLSEARVWRDAALQLFFSMGNCWGGIIALSSYNRFHNNFLRDMITVTVANWLTGIFAGLVIFSFLGYMAHTMDVSVEDVVDSGPGLAFVVYPDAVTRLPISPLWSVLFFTMLLTLGLDSEFAGMETILTTILDQFPQLRRWKPAVVSIICIVSFFLGLPLCSQGGNYLLQLMDTYSSGWSVLVIAIVFCIAIMWVYGGKRLYKDLEVVLGKKQSLWWRICCQFLTPAFILFLLIFSWVDYKPAEYGSYVYPKWADILGWVMSFASIIWIPIVAVWRIHKEYDGSILKRIRNLTLPTVYWGPALPKHRALIDYAEGFDVDPRGLQKPKIGHDNISYEKDDRDDKATDSSVDGNPFRTATSYQLETYI